MGDDGGTSGGSSAIGSNVGAEGLPVDTHGTSRDFGNMLNAYIPKRKKAKHGDSFSPWMKMSTKPQEKLR